MKHYSKTNKSSFAYLMTNLILVRDLVVDFGASFIRGFSIWKIPSTFNAFKVHFNAIILMQYHPSSYL